MFNVSLEGLGIVGCRTLGCAGSQGQVQDAHCPPTSAISGAASPSELFSLFHLGVSSRCCCERLAPEGCHQACITEPGYYSRHFVTLKVTGGWRPVINLSRLNRFTFVWRPSCRSSSLCVPGIGLFPSTFRMRTYRFLSIRNLVGTFGFVSAVKPSSFGFCVLGFQPLLKSSCVSWPRSPPSCIALAIGSSATWTTG